MNKFLLMGSTAFTLAVGGFIMLGASISQDDFYNNVVTAPVENIQDFLGIKSNVKEKYQKFVESDKEFLSQMEIPKEIIDIEVIYKSHGFVDKAFYPLMKFGQWMLNFDESHIESTDAKYEGKNSMYGAYVENGKILNEYIMLGINALEEKDIKIYKSLYKIFGYDEQKMTSFIFFHEFGHKIASAMNNEEETLDKLVTLFEKEKDVILSKESRKIMRTQYSETYADNFALMMMAKKYPDLNFEKSRDLIVGLRLDNGQETHLSSPGLVLAQKPNEHTTLKEIMKASENGALATAEFYSPIDFANISKDIDKPSIAVTLVGLDTTNVRNQINTAREKFLTNSKQDLPVYKK